MTGISFSGVHYTHPGKHNKAFTLLLPGLFVLNLFTLFIAAVN